jgi:hypothetical protein
MGVSSGKMKLLDNDNMIMFRSFTNNLCALTSKINDIASIIVPPSKGITTLPESVHFNSDITSLTNSVHNSDVTNNNVDAQEQSSCHWVSEFAGSSNEDNVSREYEHGSKANDVDTSNSQKSKNTLILNFKWQREGNWHRS